MYVINKEKIHIFKMKKLDHIWKHVMKVFSIFKKIANGQYK